MIRIKGISASRGIAIGPVYRFQHLEIDITEHCVDDVDFELHRFNACRKKVDASLAEMVADLSEKIGTEHGEIFEIQREFLDDPGFRNAIADLIEEKGINAEAAVKQIGDTLGGEFEEIGDEYFSQRAVDVRDLTNRMLRELTGLSGPEFSKIREPVILLARDLTPSDTAALPLDLTLALCTEIGGKTSHTAILSRSLGIPSVVGLGDIDIEDGTPLIVDALEGQVLIEPGKELEEEYRRKSQEFAETRARLKAEASKPAVSIDGRTIEIAANVAGHNDSQTAIEMGADSIGLLRTEFLFLGRESLPAENEQYHAYREILNEFGNRPVIIRTLDVGGDKPLPTVSMKNELNPFLGLRAVRLAMSDPERLFIPQIKAILRAAVGKPVKIMFPMIASIIEIKQVREVLEDVKERLTREKVDFSRDVQIGIMVEIPSAALLVDQFAEYVDFFSIGTNDLTQYTLAVDRTNEKVAKIAEGFHPAVLSLINMTIQKAHEHGKWVGICGELASDILAVPLLFGMGIDELSMAAPAIPVVKNLIRSMDYRKLQPLVDNCLAASMADDIRELLSTYLKSVQKS